MNEDASTLVEMMFRAEQFCIQIENTINPAMERREHEQLRLKIGHCRGLLARLQASFEDGEFSMKNDAVRGNFRYLIMALLWISFYARQTITYKQFRSLVNVEATYTYLLNVRGPASADGPGT